MIFRKLYFLFRVNLTRCFLAVFLTSGWMVTLASEKMSYPEIEIKQDSNGTTVLCNRELLLELRKNRFVRFRSGIDDENWIGSDKSPADLGWVYRDPGAKGMDVSDVTYKNDPGKGMFTLWITGKKPQFDSKISIELIGEWMSEQQKFRYRLTTSLESKLEDWYKNSKFGLRSSGGKTWTEVLDYCVEGISIPERMLSPDKSSRTKPLRYDWFVKSHDGENWKKWPKIYIPFPVRKGDYITIRELDDPSNAGSLYGFLDAEHGGWLTRIEKSPAPLIHEICWARFDVHMQLEGAIPPRGSREDLSLEFIMSFEPVSSDKAREIVRQAVEIPWRNAPEYDLPVLSLDNRFETMIKDIPSEETADYTVWWPSNYNCRQDKSVGFDDHFSLLIDNPMGNKRHVAFSSHAWKFPFSNVEWWKKRFRCSAMVKTERCDGEVRIGVYSSESGGDGFYGGGGTFDRHGKPRTNGINWTYSKSVSGTTDWTEVSFESDFVGGNMTIFLENTGAGKSWFDNVKLEKLD